jgi:hypothetical protein
MTDYRYNEDRDELETEDDPFELYFMIEDEEERWTEFSYYRFEETDRWDSQPSDYDLFLLEG